MSASYVRGFCLLGLVFAASCSGKDVDSSVQPVSVDQIKSDHVRVVQSQEFTEESRQVLSELRAEAVKQGIAQDAGGADSALMRQWADDEGGAFVLRGKLQELEEQPAEVKLKLVHDIAIEYAGTAVGAMALDHELRLLAQLRPQDFLQRTAELMAQKDDLRAGLLAYLQQIDYLAAQNDYKSCGVYALRFWGLYEKDVERLSLRIKLLGHLERAGFLLECDMVDSAQDISSVADWLGTQLWAGLSEQSGSASPIALYVQNAPNLPASLQPLPSDKRAVEDLVMRARWSRLALNSNENAASSYFNQYLTATSEATASGSLDSRQTALLLAVERGLLCALKEYSEQRKYIEATSKAIASASIKDIQEKLGDQYVQILKAHMTYLLTERREDSVCSVDFENAIDLLTSCGCKKNVLDAYVWLTSAYPDFQKTPEYLDRLAKFYAEEMQAPQKALHVLTQICQLYPDSESAPVAYLKRASIEMEGDNYQEAYRLLQEFQNAHPDHALYVNAVFAAAACEYSLGQKDQAEAHLVELAKRFRESSFAPKALYLASQWKLAEGEYDGAVPYLQQIVDAYPQSTESPESKRLLDKLTSRSSRGQ